MTGSIVFTLGLGFLLGLKHATEADHLVAVSTIVSEQRSMRKSAIVGFLWGIGHTSSLLVAGIAVIVMGIVIPQRVADLLEFGVAIMIIALGCRLVWRTQTAHTHPHHHDALKRIGWKPVMIGVVHGMAGSAALTLLILTEVVHGHSPLLGIGYLLIFGVGSILGMLSMSAMISLPFVYGAGWSHRLDRPLRLTAGVGSAVFGVFYAWLLLLRA
jgi:sulfite exporter TauE/SafE